MKARNFFSSLFFAAASLAASADSLQFSVASVAVTEGTATVVLNVTRLSPTVTVRINDNDKGFQFANATYSVGEADGNVVLSVQRIGATTITGSATWSTSNGTAIAGQDFGTLGNATQRSGTLTWAIGDAAN